MKLLEDKYSLSVYLFTCLFTCPPICLFTCLSAYLHLCLILYHLSTCLSLCMSVCVSVSYWGEHLDVVCEVASEGDDGHPLVESLNATELHHEAVLLAQRLQRFPVSLVLS